MNKFESPAVKAQCEKAAELTKSIKEAVYKFADQVPLATALGCLTLASEELIREAGDL